MRVRSIYLLTALALLTFWVSPAGAFEIRSVARNATAVSPGDTVTVDVFFDATQVGIKLFGIGLIFDPSFLTYDVAGSLALPATADAGPGTQPSYILYSPAVAGTGMPPVGAVPATFLQPQQTPSWLTFPPGMSVPFGIQIAINYAELNITDTFDTQVTGSNIWIASFVFDVNNDAPQGDTNIQLCLSDVGCPGSILQIGDVVLDPATVTKGPPVVVSVPEPAAIGLVLASGVSLCLLRIRRRRE